MAIITNVYDSNLSLWWIIYTRLLAWISSMWIVITHIGPGSPQAERYHLPNQQIEARSYLTPTRNLCIQCGICHDAPTFIIKLVQLFVQSAVYAVRIMRGT